MNAQQARKFNSIVSIGIQCYEHHNLDILRTHGNCYFCGLDLIEWIPTDAKSHTFTTVRTTGEVSQIQIVCDLCTNKFELHKKKKCAVISG